ncbi:MAG TPA: STAS domain-containing protein [Chitinispirillaceae bacterium]|nr:STAS domain-containing protein [Chitinispirillaceae bacterium]
MRCFKVTGCSEELRKACPVWNNLESDCPEMEDIKCWVIKNVYHPDQKQQLAKCKKCNYYLQMNKSNGISSDTNQTTAIIKCTGPLNNDRVRALEKVWETVKKSGKSHFILDIAEVTSIYSCAIGMIVKISTEIEQLNGKFILSGAQDFTLTLLKTVHLDKLIQFAPDISEALSAFDEQIRQQEEEKRLREVAEKEAEAAKIATRKRPPCWEYFNSHNPNNATKCDECFRKATQNTSPCWIVDGYIEGISFQFIGEDCLECSYFEEYRDSVEYPGLMSGKTTSQSKNIV